MRKSLAKLALSAATLSMIFTPVMAQANTRAGNYTTSIQSRSSASNQAAPSQVEDDDDDELGALWLALIGAAGILAGIIIIEDNADDEDGFNQSAGAN